MAVVRPAELEKFSSDAQAGATFFSAPHTFAATLPSPNSLSRGHKKEFSKKFLEYGKTGIHFASVRHEKFCGIFDHNPTGAFVTADSHNHIDVMLRVQSGLSSPPQELLPLQEAEEEKLLPALQGLSLDGKSFVRILEGRLDSMQEIFLDMLNAQLAEHCLRPEGRLQLFLSPAGDLTVEGNAHDSALLQEIIAQNPLLQRQFQEMAQVALLSHGMDMAVQASSCLLDQQEQTENPQLGRFHLCLKGSLSHFYLR